MNKLTNIIEYVKKNNGCNIDASLDLKDIKSGYMVSLKGYEKTIDLNDLNDLSDLIIQKKVFDALLEKTDTIKDLRQFNRKSNFCIGLWYNNDDKKLYIDISVNIKNKRVAIEQGIKNLQYYVYDVVNDCDIPLQKDVFIVYRYNRALDDFIYQYECTSQKDVCDMLKTNYMTLYNNIVKSIDNFDLSKLYLNKYAIVKDKAFYRDLNG